MLTSDDELAPSPRPLGRASRHTLYSTPILSQLLVSPSHCTTPMSAQRGYRISPSVVARLHRAKECYISIQQSHQQSRRIPLIINFNSDGAA